MKGSRADVSLQAKTGQRVDRGKLKGGPAMQREKVEREVDAQPGRAEARRKTVHNKTSMHYSSRSQSSDHSSALITLSSCSGDCAKTKLSLL